MATAAAEGLPPPVFGLQERVPITAVLVLAYQSFGVVYGELSTSPLYLYRSTFSGKASLHESDDEILGVLSFILYTLTLIPLIKYVFIVLSASDNGEGGTFALYSLLCRHARLSLLPNQQDADLQLSTYNMVGMPQRSTHGLRVKSFLESHHQARVGLLLVVLFGTCMVIADGVFTPAISVAGFHVAVPTLSEGVVKGLSCIILACLFTLQHYGTRRVAFLFAPIVILWLLCISSIGVYNIVVYNPLQIWAAFNPMYMYKLLKICGKDSWISLGGIVLCITGTEAMFADLGHFNQQSIKIAFAIMVYPLLLLGYIGQAAYLTKNRTDVSDSFFKSIPKPVFWPVLGVATLAAIVGSQAVISATFSIIKQCVALCCFPRVKIIHTSKEIHGQIYIPEINWILFLLCMATTIGFGDTVTMGNAYGFAVITVMLVTTFLMVLVILIVWGQSIFVALTFLLIFGSIEALFVSASVMKIRQGGWVPLALTSAFMTVMFIWNYGTSKKFKSMDSKVKWDMLGCAVVPGVALYYTEHVTDDVPLLLSTFVTHLPAMHNIMVFVTIKSVPVPYVPSFERNLFSRIGPHRYRCIVRYGYKDIRKVDDAFEVELFRDLSNFIWTSEYENNNVEIVVATRSRSTRTVHAVDTDLDIEMRNVLFGVIEAIDSEQPSHRTSGRAEKRLHCGDLQNPSATWLDRPRQQHEVQMLKDAQAAGVVYFLGHSYVKASNTSSKAKKIAINYVYNFLRRISRGPSVELHIPQASSIEIGVLYVI